MSEKTYKWQKIANNPAEMDFGEGQIAVAEAGDKKICVARFKEKLYAISYRCPHAGGHLEGGKIDMEGNIVCPIHSYRYNIQNGFNSSGEGFHLKHWPLEIREDGVYVQMEESTGLFGFLK